jgi:hypothetical protein
MLLTAQTQALGIRLGVCPTATTVTVSGGPSPPCSCTETLDVRRTEP